MGLLKAIFLGSFQLLAYSDKQMFEQMQAQGSNENQEADSGGQGRVVPFKSKRKVMWESTASDFSAFSFNLQGKFGIGFSGWNSGGE
jgi:hypothetical protein